jgi:Fe-S-cluster containining protein
MFFAFKFSSGMNSKQRKIAKKYNLLINKIDREVERLAKMHSNHLQCKKGCDLCCMDYSIFPVEYYAILDNLKAVNFHFETDVKDDNSCAFLKDHACSIYENRPVICRTHGLPLIYMNDDHEWELSNCELNFNDFDFDEFTINNTFQQDKFNSSLFVLNKEFISDFVDNKFSKVDLIPLKNLAKELKNNND